MTSHNTDMPQEQSNNDEKKLNTNIKRKRKDLLQISNVEEELRIKRIKQLMTQEEQLANIKLNHEEKLAIMKEEHLKVCNIMQLKHLQEVQKLEIEINKSKLRAINSEYQFTDKENIDSSINK